jgi:hypothetical protein
MRNSLLAIVVVAMPASIASTEASRSQKLDKPTTLGRAIPVKRTGSSNSCAAYGPGFVKVEGTETCVKIGGAVSIGVGSSSGSR